LHPHITHQVATEHNRALIAAADRARAAARPSRLGRRARVALLAAAVPLTLAAVALPSAAEAASISAGSGTVFVLDRGFSGFATEQNDVAIRVVGSSLVITDTAGVTVAQNDAGCVGVSSVEARCVATRVATVSANLGAGGDRIDYRAPQGGGVTMGPGNDRVFAGRREATGRAIQPFRYAGDEGLDAIGYAAATTGVVVDMADGVANDGRPGDRENIERDFEQLEGSEFRDTLFGTARPDIIFGVGDRDIIAGGGGDDVFFSPGKDGADDYHGGPGRDTIDYSGRTQPLKVTLDNIANDGETDGRFTVEGDSVRSNVENVNGGSGADTLTSFGVFSRLDGRGGVDTLTGGDGPDTLIGGPGRDSLDAGGGNDVLDARDGEPDFADCGTEFDTLSRDTSEGILRGCETQTVGVLRLADKVIDAQAGKPAPVKLSWRHPDGWRKLRSVTLRLTRDGVAAGEVTIRPRGERITADGVVKVVRRGTRLTRRGKTVSARLALRIDASMAGQRLGLEVEATDKQGRRQLERNAGTIRVAK
jgi:hypothetical protein